MFRLILYVYNEVWFCINFNAVLINLYKKLVE